MGGQLLGGGRRRSGRRAGRGMVSEINVTPFVDVMLVLLIIFMVTAPMLTVGVPVDLPKTQARTLQQDKEPLIISVNAKGEIFLQEQKLELDALAPRLMAITNANPEARIFVRADQALNYGRMLQVMGTVSAAGFRKVALVADLPGSSSGAAVGTSGGRQAR